MLTNFILIIVVIAVLILGKGNKAGAETKYITALFCTCIQEAVTAHLIYISYLKISPLIKESCFMVEAEYLIIKQKKYLTKNMSNKVHPVPLENDSEIVVVGSCRICLEEGVSLLRPCDCTGTIEYVHEKCMAQWILSKLKYNPKKKKQYCQICQCEIHYVMKKIVEMDCEEISCTKINSCYLLGLFMAIVIDIVLGIILHFNEEMFTTDVGRIILIICITLVSICICITIFGLVYTSCTKKKYQIAKIYEIQQWRLKSHSRLEIRSGGSLSRSHQSRRVIMIESRGSRAVSGVSSQN